MDLVGQLLTVPLQLRDVRGLIHRDLRFELNIEIVKLHLWIVTPHQLRRLRFGGVEQHANDPAKFADQVAVGHIRRNRISSRADRHDGARLGFEMRIFERLDRQFVHRIAGDAHAAVD